MNKILACIDGSTYADNVCHYAAWVAQRLDASIDILHVLRRHSDYEAPASDHTGSIGLGARSHLLEALTRVDEERGKLDQQKGKIILEHAKEVLESAGQVKQNISTLHKRGSLAETVTELQDLYEIIFIGKRGEHADDNSEFLGSNFEKVARAIHKPLFVAPPHNHDIKKFVLAYDCKDNARLALDFVCNNPLLQNLECHLLSINLKDQGKAAAEAASKIEKAGFALTQSTDLKGNPEEIIAHYVEHHHIDLLLTGAYSHSKMRSILLGSTTANLIKSCKIPLLLFR